MVLSSECCFCLFSFLNMSKKGGENMLGKESIFDELLRKTKSSIEKSLIKDIFDLVKDFYYVLDIHNECNTNLKIFNYLFSDLEIYTLEEIAEKLFVSDKTIKRFKKKTEKIVTTLIKTNKQYEILSRFFQKHKNT